MDAGEYCRAVESHLCAKNDGHLIRIVGPAFEMVRGWAETGIPLSVVRRGIDQRYARYYARGSRRHPLRIDFCEADILTLFDDWKRAVHVSAAAVEDNDARFEAGGTARTGRRSLAAHLDHLAAALAAWTPPVAQATPTLDRAIARARAVIDESRPAAGTLRGAARRVLIERLAALDLTLAAAARQDTDRAIRAAFREEAAESLAPFRERMRPGAFARALDTATDHLLADHCQLARLTYE